MQLRETALLIPLLTSVIACSSAIAQPEEAPSSVTTGVVHPEKPGRRQRPQVDRLQPGVVSEYEAVRVSAVCPDCDPRRAIATYANKLCAKMQRPVLSQANLQFVSDPSLEKTFPSALFYVLRFPQWPVPLDPPAPLSSNNLFILSKDKSLKLITDTSQLEQHFRQNLASTTSGASARTALLTWLALSSELAQDGMYQFHLDNQSVNVSDTSNGQRATGKLLVKPRQGDSGFISATLEFDKSGKMRAVAHELHLQEGIRPICQSKKLLDHDPVVRRMAEKDLLVMGKAAGFYLQEQMKTAKPELRREIQRIWTKILEENR